MEKESIVLIPTLNERKNLEKLIPSIFGLMPEISVLVVDDNSNDGTGELVQDLQNVYQALFFLRRRENFGYGKACIDGFKEISRLVMLFNNGTTSQVVHRDFKFVVTMDADFSHDYRVVPELLGKLSDSEVVVGSRYVRGGKIENWKFHRKVLSRVANLYVRLILKLKIHDLTTGFNAYRRKALEKINLNEIKSDGYAFLVELKYMLVKAGAKITEYPITFSERREGQSKMSGKIIWESVKLPWRLLLS